MAAIRALHLAKRSRGRERLDLLVLGAARCRPTVKQFRCFVLQQPMFLWKGRFGRVQSHLACFSTSSGGIANRRCYYCRAYEALVVHSRPGGDGC